MFEIRTHKSRPLWNVSRRNICAAFKVSVRQVSAVTSPAPSKTPGQRPRCHCGNCAARVRNSNWAPLAVCVRLCVSALARGVRVCARRVCARSIWGAFLCVPAPSNTALGRYEWVTEGDGSSSIVLISRRRHNKTPAPKRPHFVRETSAFDI
ncbi:unnamed protein product, partial [Iphiclides podalirius]